MNFLTPMRSMLTLIKARWIIALVSLSSTHVQIAFEQSMNIAETH